MQTPGNPGNGDDRSQHVPEVKIVHGVPKVVYVSECHLEADGALSGVRRYTAPKDFGAARRNELEVLNDANVMIRVPGTFDTYECKDCNIVLSGYKRGDPGLHQHVQSGGGQCRYIKAKYRGHEKELLITQGKLRFQNGGLAFPDFVLYATDGYVTIAGTKHCIVCACQSGEDHYIACMEMGNRIKTTLKSLKLDVSIDNTPLFTKRVPGPENRWGDFEPDSALAYMAPDFSVMGESANMYHLPQTVDTHKCFRCSLEIKHFVQNDTLLGEHIYHVYNTGGECPYIAERYKHRRHKLMLILGNERYRKGLIAFPDTVITKASYGYTTVGGLNRCVICSAMTVHGKYLPAQGHRLHCDEMKTSLQLKLKNMKFLL